MRKAKFGECATEKMSVTPEILKWAYNAKGSGSKTYDEFMRELREMWERNKAEKEKEGGVVVPEESATDILQPASPPTVDLLVPILTKDEMRELAPVDVTKVKELKSEQEDILIL